MLLFTTIWSIDAFASHSGQGQSIMFEQPKSDLTSIPGSSDANWEECKALSREIEALKGKPQRRYAASQRYEAQCKDFRK